MNDVIEAKICRRAYYCRSQSLMHLSRTSKFRGRGTYIDDHETHSELDSSSPNDNVNYTILPDIDAMATTASLIDFVI